MVASGTNNWTYEWDTTTVEDGNNSLWFRSYCNGAYSDIVSLNLDLDKELKNKQQLYYGLEYSFNKVRSTAFRENIRTGETTPAASRYPDGGSDYSYTAIYGSYQNSINPNMTFSAGARYTQTWLNARTNNTFVRNKHCLFSI